MSAATPAVPLIVTPLTHGEALELAAALCPMRQVICPKHQPERCSLCAAIAKLAMDVDAASRAQALEQYAVVAMVRALREIRKGEGPFNRDALLHAGNVIQRSKDLASEALALVEPLLCSDECAQRYHHDGPHDGQTAVRS